MIVMLVHLLVLVFSVQFTPSRGEAHIVGSMPWCLSYSPFHKECMYETESLCIKDVKKDPTLSVSNETRALPANFEAYCEENPFPNRVAPSFFKQPY